MWVTLHFTKHKYNITSLFYIYGAGVDHIIASLLEECQLAKILPPRMILENTVVSQDSVLLISVFQPREGLQHIAITLSLFASRELASNFTTTSLENAIQCGRGLSKDHLSTHHCQSEQSILFGSVVDPMLQLSEEKTTIIY